MAWNTIELVSPPSQSAAKFVQNLFKGADVVSSISLDKLTQVTVEERLRVANHAVPGMAGDEAQVMGRSSVQVTIDGVFFGEKGSDSLRNLRTLYLRGEPLDFHAEAVGEGYFGKVLITGLQVFQRASGPDEFSYRCQLVEYAEPQSKNVNEQLASIESSIKQEAEKRISDVVGVLTSPLS